jgi:hypothetical protein
MPDIDTAKFINIHQIGGIEQYTLDAGEGRGVRAMLVNTGAGLRYRVLVDRGLDIDQAFFNQHSLTFLTHKGVTAPTRALDRGADWLKAFPGGLVTSCGPMNIGRPATDQGEELGLHGTHSTTAADLEMVIQPDLRRGKDGMSITGTVRYGKLFGPCIELRRTIVSRVGTNSIEFTDEFFNAGNEDVPHAWLLHINFGYPLLDEGSEFCYDAKVEPREDDVSQRYFAAGKDYRRMPSPLDEHRGRGEAVAYLFPKADEEGRAVVGVVNPKLQLGLVIRYSTKEFPRCANWQHWGKHEYVAALEPMNGTVGGRDKDRAAGLLDTLKAGQRKTYRYAIEVLTGPAVQDLLRLNHA